MWRMKKYDEYKESGFGWIGEVPSQWSNLRLRFVCEFRNGYTPSKANPEFWEDGSIPWYRMEDIRETGRKLNEAKQYITKEAVKGGGLFEAGSFILATTATIGEHAVLIVDSLANQQFTNLRIRKSLEATLLRDYFFYYLFVIDDYCKATTKTSTFPAVSMELLKNCHVVFPSVEEQQYIVDFLDKNCGEIDKVISAQQKRIALLQDLKQSVITHAVTKGLNPNVEMKDSRVEWIGKVPKHWEVMKTSLAFQGIGSGTTPSTSKPEYYNEETGKFWLQTGDLNDGIITDTSKKVTEVAIRNCNLKFYPKDSVVIAMYGATIGKVGILGIDTSTNQACCVLPKSINMSAKFSFYEFFACKPALLVSAIGGGQPNISQDTIKKQKIVVPPLSEQHAIATYLEKKCASIDSSISKAQHQVALLQEYMQSLITEVVTGKRKVC